MKKFASGAEAASSAASLDESIAKIEAMISDLDELRGRERNIW